MTTENKSRANLYEHINKIKADSSTSAVVATASMPATTKSVPVYDADGVLLGYAALYANANLT